MIRSVAFLTAAALAGLASPAFGQDYNEPPLEPADSYDAYDSGYEDAEIYDDDRQEWREEDDELAANGLSRGYSLAQRRDWIEQCSQVYYGGDRGERRGEVIGGVLGGVAGAVAGNRILDDSRVLGTVLGGGVGVVAGSVIGGAIGEDSDRDRYDRAVRQCEDYMVRYERSFAGGEAYGQPGYAYVRVPARIQRVVRTRRLVQPTEFAEPDDFAEPIEYISEEVVQEVVQDDAYQEVAVPARPAERVRAQRRAPSKTVRYTK